MSTELGTDTSAADLRAAWDDMLGRLTRARDALDSPELHAPPHDPRLLAEGYRYLLGFAFGAIERSFFGDPDFPYFRRAVQIVDKATIDNSDAMYLTAVIDGSRSYRVRGRAADHRHWNGEPPVTSGPKAPQYVIFEVGAGYAGDSGSILELRPGGGRIGTGSLDISDLVVDAEGRFEILLAPSRPEDHEANFIATQRVTRDGRTWSADNLTLRVLFHDWEREQALDLHIEQIGKEGLSPPVLDPAKAAHAMRRVGEIVDNQMRFWNEFYDVVLETYGDRNGDGQCMMPRNDLNEPNAAALATGGGQSTNIYSGGIYELAADQALVIETEVPIPPLYSGFHLSNLWGESHDYANRQSSLNGHQAQPDPDGRIRYVVSHTDPGVPNWLDTTGLAEGFMAVRWSYAKVPDQLPSVRVALVPADEVRQHLHPDTPQVTPAARREQIAIRQQHVQRRYRQY